MDATGSSCTSVAIARWVTPRWVNAMRQASSAVFSSRAGNLAGSQAPRGTSRIHVRDLDKRTTLRIDLPGGAPVDADCLLPDISADGRFVVFQTASAGFGEDENDFQDVYLHDLLTRRTTRVSVASDGTEGNGYSYWPTISGDGRFVAFHSTATNFVPDDTNGTHDVFVHDRETGEHTQLDATALFVFIGADPNTGWLSGEVGLDDKDFVLTGRDLDGKLGDGAAPPLFLETSAPGVFAVGDVRSGSIKRVASAVGEGSMAVRLVHQRLAAA